MPLPSYVVRHSVKNKANLLSNKHYEISRAPCSFTSNASEAKAAEGNYIYVVEAQRVPSREATIYRLGYKFRSFKPIYLDGGDLWPHDKKYKNAPKIGSIAEGKYFKDPVEITNLEFIEWYKSAGVAIGGMCEIKSDLVKILDDLFDNSSLSNPALGYVST